MGSINAISGFSLFNDMEMPITLEVIGTQTIVLWM